MADSRTDLLVVGKPLSFWREQMPADMYLRIHEGPSVGGEARVDEMLR